MTHLCSASVFSSVKERGSPDILSIPCAFAFDLLSKTGLGGVFSSTLRMVLYWLLAEMVV